MPALRCKEKVYALKARPYHWVCKNSRAGGRSGYRFSLITRTIFQDTKVPLKTWFKVGYLMLTAKKGISALQVHRVIFGDELRLRLSHLLVHVPPLACRDAG